MEMVMLNTSLVEISVQLKVPCGVCRIDETSDYQTKQNKRQVETRGNLLIKHEIGFRVCESSLNVLSLFPTSGIREGADGRHGPRYFRGHHCRQLANLMINTMGATA